MYFSLEYNIQVMGNNFSKCFLYAFVIGFFMTNVSTAQNDFASIRKNVNILANSLKHDLCKTKDTLILQGEESIKRLYTIGEKSGLIDEYIFTKNYRLPLNNFKNGRYVFVVLESRKRIVFEVNILNNKLPEALIVAEIPNSEAVIKEKSSVVKLSVEERKAAIRLAEHRAKKAYNLTDTKRDGMQSREEMKIIMVEEREKKRVKPRLQGEK